MFFDLFKKKENKPGINYSVVKVDIHSHLIPGIDDGAQNLNESITLIKSIADLGFKKIITTPHIMADYYRNTPERILSGLDSVREELNKQGVNIEIEAAAEYYLDETFETKLEKGGLLTLGDKHLLFELSYINYPNNLFEIIAKIQDKGYTPILAHPERYPYLSGTIENYERIKDAGCYLQLNTISLTGYYGKSVQKIAEEMVDHYLIDFIGSDMHHMRHQAALRNSLKMDYVVKLLTDYQLQNPLFYTD